MAGVVSPYRYDSQLVTAGTSGSFGVVVGDYLHELVITVTTSATSQVTLTDGLTFSCVIVPNGASVGVITIPIESQSKFGEWGIVTGAGVECLAVGIFGLTLQQSAINIARQYNGALLFALNNLSNLFQNSNGTVAVTASGDPIGFWGDTSGNGFNATQPTGANKPVLSRFSNNLLRWTESFDNAVWSKSASTISANATTAPDGTSTADALIEDTTTAIHQVFQNITSIGNSVQGVNSIYAKPNGRNFIRILLFDGVNNGGASFNLTNGQVLNVSAGITATATLVDNGFYRCSIAYTQGASSSISRLQVQLSPDGGTTSYLGNGTSGVFIWGAQLNLGATALPYEPVDLYPRQGNFGILTDGTNDFMTITPPPITNACTIVWAGRVNAMPAVVGLIAVQNTGGVQVDVLAAGNVRLFKNGGTQIGVTSGNVIVANQSVVISVRLNAGVWTVRKNGVLVSTFTDAQTFTGTTMTLFALATAQFPLNALTADFFIDNVALPDADLLQIERHAGSIAGVTIP